MNLRRRQQINQSCALQTASPAVVTPLRSAALRASGRSRLITLREFAVWGGAGQAPELAASCSHAGASGRSSWNQVAAGGCPYRATVCAGLTESACTRTPAASGCAVLPGVMSRTVPLVAGLVRPPDIHDLDGQVASRAEHLVRHCGPV